jgi:hypothetical protein
MNVIKQLLFAFLAVILLTGFTFAQTAKQPIEKNLYVRALTEILPKLDNVIIENNLFLNSGFPKQINSSPIDYLDNLELIKRYKEKKQDLRVIRMFPMSNEGNLLEISFNYYWVNYKRKSLNFSLEGGIKVIFRYDCDRGEYVVDKTVPWAV